MKIAFLTSEFPVLSETPFLNQITGLIRRGHELDIFADKPQPGVSFHPDVENLGLLARTRYPATLPLRQSWSAVVDILKSQRGASRRILLRTLNPFLFWRRAWSLEQFRRTVAFLPPRTYDVCYCAFGQDAVKAMRLRRVGALRDSMVVAFRGADTTKYVANRGRRTYASVFKAGSLFLPVCEALSRRIVAMGAPPEKIVVHRTGIDLRRWKFHARNFTSSGPLRVLTIARLVEKKGIEFSLRAVRQVLDRGIGVRYEVVGDGPQRERLEHLCRELDLCAHVQLLGWRTQDQIQALLERADVLVAPSVTASNQDEEGIPNVLKEAMATGLPVISTEHGGIPELVEDGVGGLLVPQRSVEPLVDGLLRLRSRPDLCHELARNGRIKVEREYDIERLNDRLVDLFSSLPRR